MQIPTRHQTTTTGGEPRTLSNRTLRAYAGDWALFTDWCTSIGGGELPADPDMVTRFLRDCAAAPSTLRRRVAAIDHHHVGAGLPRPGESPTVRAALGRPTREPTSVAPATLEAVESALSFLPSHGWTQGMFGRRDRCLIVLSQLMNLSYRDLSQLTAGRVTVAGGVASAAGAIGITTVRATSNPVLCGPCAIARWLRVLNVVMTKPSHRVLAEQLRDATPVTQNSPHLCRSNLQLSSLILDAPLLPSIDQWGYVPFPLQRLTPHSLSHLVQQMLAGDFVAHRRIAIDEELAEPKVPAPPAQVTARVYTKDDSQRAWARRRADLDDLNGVDEQLDDIDRRVAELNIRAALLLDTL